MKIRALAVAALLCGCNQQVPTYTSSSGSLALSSDDGTLYAVDSDSNQLFVIDARTDEVKASVQVGRQPEKVVVGRDDTVYVSNRMGRSVSVIRYGEWSEAVRLDTAVEPSGMAVSGDTLLVVNATMLDNAGVGSLMAFDTKSLSLLWEVAVGPEPRAIAVSGNNALISLYKEAGSKTGGDIVTVDLRNHQVLSAKTETYANINKSALESTTVRNDFNGEKPPDGVGLFGPRTLRPRGIESLAVSPDGDQVYATTLLSSDQVLPATAAETSPSIPGGGGGQGYGGGSCGAGSVATPSVLTFDGEGRSMATDVAICQGRTVDGVPPQVLTSGNPTMPIQGPSAVAVDPTGAFLFIAGRESNNVAIVSANGSTQNNQNNTTTGGGFTGEPAPIDGRSPNGSFFVGQGSVHTTVSVGAGPSGVALARDGKTAWVHNAFDHSISRLERKDGVVQTTRTAQFTTDVLSPQAVAGRKLFFSAVDSRMSATTTGISCASCHLEGREDGHVWNFTDGPRQTPSLAGRMLSKTAPFHWNGEFEGLTQFMAVTVNHRMGGAGVSKAMEDQIMAFIESQPAADNPHKLAGGLSPAQQRGFAAFVKAQCNNCHKGEALTDNSFVNVGTFVTGKALSDNLARFAKGGLNTPSLLGVARTSPYLHDGSALTLKDRIMGDRTRHNELHGSVAVLSDAEVDDLVEYLKAL